MRGASGEPKERAVDPAEKTVPAHRPHVFAALAAPADVNAHRSAALEPVHLRLEDWQLTQDRVSQAEQRMVAVLDGRLDQAHSMGCHGHRVHLRTAA
jgi:hypothetical protein